MNRIRHHALRMFAAAVCIASSLVCSTLAFAGPATHFTLNVPGNAPPGSAFSFSVVARDASESQDCGYGGTVQFAASPSVGVTLPANSTLSCGFGTFSVTMANPGAYTITATDTVTSSITGTSSSIFVANPPNFTTSINETAGATLLFPYFEVDTSSSTGRNTVLTLENTSATAILGHATVWTDLGVPVLTFNIYLTGYDVESIDMHDVFVNGNLPATASAGQDPGDQISPKGMFSQDINFASCYGQIPYPPNALLSTFRKDLRAALSGQAATFLGGKCSGFNHGDSILRGYVTIDTVNNCTQKMPTDPGYFASGGSGDATNQNVMAGEYYLFQASTHLMHSGPAVAIHASGSDTYLSTANNTTFYGRIDATPWSAVDNRTPLPNTWAVDAQAAGTELIVWRDIKIPPTTFTCGSPGNVPPSMGLPLGQQRAFSFDNQEQPLAIPAGSPFGLATQRVVLGGAAFPLPTKPGWIYLGLSYQNPTVSAANATSDAANDQAYVTVLQYPESHGTSTGTGAFALDSGEAPQHSHPLD